jgi:hypothetical protein
MIVSGMIHNLLTIEKFNLMKKATGFDLLFLMTIFSSLILLSSCEKSSFDTRTLLGTWISSDSIDTVEFRTENDFYKTVGMPKDHFNYSLSEDSITIQYDGVLKILIIPANHFYTLDGDTLTIDLKSCYGFRNQIISFIRKKQ